MVSRSSSVAKEAKHRDGLVCLKCGVSHSSAERFDAHHIIPLHADGTDEVDNLATLCPHCPEAFECKNNLLFHVVRDHDADMSGWPRP